MRVKAFFLLFIEKTFHILLTRKRSGWQRCFLIIFFGALMEILKPELVKNMLFQKHYVTQREKQPLKQRLVTWGGGLKAV